MDKLKLIIDALQRCADMDSSTAMGYRIDAENCSLSHSETIRDRAELLLFRAEKSEERASEYRRAISSQEDVESQTNVLIDALGKISVMVPAVVDGICFYLQFDQDGNDAGEQYVDPINVMAEMSCIADEALRAFNSFSQIKVGTSGVRRPPRRSRRAELPHRAPQECAQVESRSSLGLVG